MQSINVFDYNCPKDFLVSALKEKQAKNLKFSLRSWSRQLGFSSPNMLSMILRGERSLKPVFASRVAASLGLNGLEKQYFEMLIIYSKTKNPEEKEVYSNIIKQIRPDKRFSTVDLDTFRLISDWYHVAIIEMANLKNFKFNVTWIARRLGQSVNTSMIEKAMERLVRLGFFKQTEDGNFIKASENETISDVPNEAIKKFHSQMIHKSINALENHPVDTREISSNTFTIDTSKIRQAKDMIRKFQSDLSKLVGSTQGDKTYQLNVQFFNLTDGEE